MTEPVSGVADDGKDAPWWRVRVRIFTGRFFAGYGAGMISDDDAAEVLPYPMPRSSFHVAGYLDVNQVQADDLPAWVRSPPGPPPDARVLQDDGTTGALPEGDEPWEDAEGDP